MSHVRQRQRHEGAQTRSPREGELSSLTDLESRVSVAEVGHGQFWLVKAVRFIELGSPSIHEQSETRDKVGATNDKSTLAQATLTMSTTVAATTGLASAGHGSSARRLAIFGGRRPEGRGGMYARTGVSRTERCETLLAVEGDVEGDDPATRPTTKPAARVCKRWTLAPDPLPPPPPPLPDATVTPLATFDSRLTFTNSCSSRMSASAKLIAAVYIENLAAVVDILASSVGVSLVVYRTTKELVASCSLVSDARRSHSLTAARVKQEPARSTCWRSYSPAVMVVRTTLANNKHQVFRITP